MKYFFDTEFIDGPFPQLLAIGIVAEDGREFYAENGNTDILEANEWVWEHVVPKFTGPIYLEHELKKKIQEFVAPTTAQIQFWAWYGAWDWFLLCQLFGGFLHIPVRWPRRFHELEQEMEHAKVDARTVILKDDLGEHHALHDARWNKLLYDKIKNNLPQ